MPDQMITLDRNSRLSSFIENGMDAFIRAILFAEQTAGTKPGASRLEVATNYATSILDVPVIPDFVSKMVIRGIIATIYQLAKRLHPAEWRARLACMVEPSEVQEVAEA